MGNYQRPTIDYFLRHWRPSVIEATKVKRTIIPIGKEFVIDFADSTKTARPIVKGESLVRKMPLDGSRNLLNLKASLYMKNRKGRIGSKIKRDQANGEIHQKVGLVSSGSTAGRIAQGVGSYVTPGNISKLRSPIRSGIYSALTPGGGSALQRLMPNKPTRGYRCPAGFEFGGRFTDNQFSTCGAQLFEIPGPLALLARAARRVNNNPPTARVESLSQVIEGNPTGARSVQIQRMAQIPRTGAFNKDGVSKSVADAITVLKGAPAGEGRMIRRDGIMLRPLVASSVLRQFSGNPDMLDGVMVRAMQVPKDIASDDLALLAGASMSRISFVAPNGTLLTVERARPLTVGERRKFGRVLNQVVGTSDQYDVGNNIRDFANSSNGAFKYTESFPNVDKPNDLIEVTDSNGRKRQVRRWVYETFMSNGKGKRVQRENDAKPLRSDTTTGSVTASSVDDAIKLLNDGADPFDIDGEYLSEALKKSQYEKTSIDNGTRWTRGDKSYLEFPDGQSNGAIGRRVYADVASQLGLDTQTVRIFGEEGKRKAFIEDLGNIDPRGTGKKSDPRDVLRIAMADYLLHKKDRNPAMLGKNPKGGTAVIPVGNNDSAGAGLTAAEIKKLYALDVPDYLQKNGAGTYANSFVNLTPQERKMLTSLYDDLLERAKKFKWKEYISSVSASGKLSSSEQQHLSVIQGLYEARLSNLIKTKKNFLQNIGIA